MPVEWGGNSKTCAQCIDSIGERALAPNDPPYFKVYVNIGDLGVVRALRSAVLALDVRKLDGSKRFADLVRIPMSKSRRNPRS